MTLERSRGIVAHESCICGHGEPCYHEAFVFAVGETADRAVKLDLLQCNGWLSRLTIRNFSSWRKSRDAVHLKSKRKVRRFHKTAMIDRIIRHEHGLTIDCFGIAYIFFGREVTITVEDVQQVDPPRHFGDAAGESFRRMYLPYFRQRGQV